MRDYAFSSASSRFRNGEFCIEGVLLKFREGYRFTGRPSRRQEIVW